MDDRPALAGVLEVAIDPSFLDSGIPPQGGAESTGCTSAGMVATPAAAALDLIEQPAVLC